MNNNSEPLMSPCPSCGREGTTGCPYPHNTSVIVGNCEGYTPRFAPESNQTYTVGKTYIVNSETIRHAQLADIGERMHRNIGREVDNQIIKKINSTAKENKDK